MTNMTITNMTMSNMYYIFIFILFLTLTWLVSYAGLLSTGLVSQKNFERIKTET